MGSEMCIRDRDAVAAAVTSQSVSADVQSPQSEAVAFDDPVLESPLGAITTGASQPVSADVNMFAATVESNVNHSIATSSFYRRSSGMCNFLVQFTDNFPLDMFCRYMYIFVLNSVNIRVFDIFRLKS